MALGFLTVVIYVSIYLGLFAVTFYILSFMEDSKKKREFFEEEDLPSVSVVIPAYNEEKSIVKTVKSVLKSIYPKDRFEVIVVDDGSKDRTYELAKRLSKQFKNVKVFTKKNGGGKGDALNFGIERAKGEIIFTMDADTFVEPQSLKKMVHYFTNKEVMSVTPAMVVFNPKSVWQRIQQVEYVFGLFLRKAFASVNSLYITPGAFSAYRKSFFDKYGLYEVGNPTEDLEMSLRIQYHKYSIENSPDSPAYTIAPKTFKELLSQRKRWYTGLMKNTWRYRKVISSKYGDLGIFVIPIFWISIMFAVIVTATLLVKTLLELKSDFLLLNSVNFSVSNLLNLNFYFFERVFFLFFSNPVIIFLLFFVVLMGFYLVYAKRKLGKISGLAINLPLFFIFFAILFGFWWIVSFFYVLFNKGVKWKYTKT